MPSEPKTADDTVTQAPDTTDRDASGPHAASATAPTLVERPGGGAPPRQPPPDPPQQHDDPDYPELSFVDGSHYTDGREVARGGMGRISVARDRRLGRRVAIKELVSRNEWLAARFEREARITARLQHPNIIHVYEAGRWHTGEPFYAMNLVNGRPLHQLIHEATTTAARLALVSNVVGVVDALAYAHSEGVIHRDLKPSNVLVGAFGETVVIDWGLAKDLSAPEQAPSTPPTPVGSSVETVAGTVLGTPAYMPPEQAAGKPVGATADVYALGAMLYHVLAGVPPYDARTSDELLAMLAARPPRPLAELIPNAPPDLVAIVEKAMARDPERRFPTAKEMAAELHRFQTGQLVTTYRYTTRELMRRWIRRHRAAVAVASLAVLVLLIVGAFSLTRIIGAERRARTAQARAEHRADQVTLAQARASLETDPTATLGWLAQLSGDPQVWLEARSIAADAASRGVAHVLQAGSGEIGGLVFSSDGARLASASDDHVVRVWDLATWTAREVGHTQAKILAIAFAGADVHAVDAAGTIYRCADRCAVVTTAGPIARAVFSPDGGRAVLFGEASALWDQSAAAPRSLGAYDTGAWSPDGSRVVLAGKGGVDRLDVVTGASVSLFTGEDHPIAAVATDGARVWVSRLGERQVFELVDGRLVEQHWEHDGPVTRLASLDGAIVSASSDEQLQVLPDARARVFRAGDRSIVVWHRYHDFERLVGHAGNITALAAAQRGGMIASGGDDGTIRVWRIAGPGRLSDESYRPSTIAALADHERAIVTGRAGWPVGARPSFDVIDVATGAVHALACCDPPIAESTAGPGVPITPLRLAAAEDGKQFVVLDSEGAVTAWDLDREHGRRLAESATLISISRDGRTVAVAGSDGAIRAFDTATGTARSLGSVTGGATALACSGDGAQVAAAGRDGIHLLGKDSRVLDASEERISSLAFSADGGHLVGGGGGDAFGLYVWDLASSVRRIWTGHTAPIEVVAFAPDGASVASGSADKTVRVWRLADGTSTVLRGQAGPIGSLAFSKDGRSLVTASEERICWLWDLEAGTGRALRGHQAFVLVAGFTADQRIVSVGSDGAVRFHRDDLPRHETGLRGWLASATNLVDGRSPSASPPRATVGCAPGEAEDHGRCLDIAAALHGLRWQLPCEPHRGSDACPSALPRTAKSITLGGDQGMSYDVTIRLRGVVEEEAYTGGHADGHWQIGGTPTERTFNIYELRTSSPEQVYFLNAGNAGVRHVTAIDYQKTIRVAGGATVTLSADAQDTRQIANQDAKGQPLIIPGVAPAPAPFDGQFIQMDVLSVVPVQGATR